MAKRPDPSRTTLIEWAYAKTGSMLKASRVVSFVVAWDVARRQLDKPRITAAEHAAYWREAESTTYKHLAEFREVFDARPDLMPDDVLDLLEAQRAALSAPADFGGLVAA
jgi:hypothetical protein